MAEEPVPVMTGDSSSSSFSSSSTELTLPQTNDDKKNDKLQVIDSNDDNNNNGVAKMKKKKKKSVNILKVALMLFRGRSRKSNNAAVDVASKGKWKQLVSAMRPLHLQSNNDHSPEEVKVVLPSLPSTEPAPVLHASLSRESFEDFKSTASSVDGMSRYASAINLQELDQNDDDKDKNDNEIHVDMNSGDEMIDAKAEMFIAQFYEQMRLQRSNSIVRYNKMIERSIG